MTVVYLAVEKDAHASLLQKNQTFRYDRVRYSPEFFLRLAIAFF
jgi:hypothetical protein